MALSIATAAQAIHIPPRAPPPPAPPATQSAIAAATYKQQQAAANQQPTRYQTEQVQAVAGNPPTAPGRQLTAAPPGLEQRLSLPPAPPAAPPAPPIGSTLNLTV